MSAVAEQAAVRIEGLTVSYRRRRKLLRVLNDVSFEIGHGEAYGLVGESGCGKTTAAMALMRYLPDNAVVDGGRIMFGDEDVLTASDSTLRKWRGERMAMVYQGEIILAGTPDEFRATTDHRVKDFIEGLAPVNEDVETLLRA